MGFLFVDTVYLYWRGLCERNHKVVIENLPSIKGYWHVFCEHGPLMNDGK